MQAGGDREEGHDDPDGEVPNASSLNRHHAGSGVATAVVSALRKRRLPLAVKRIDGNSPPPVGNKGVNQNGDGSSKMTRSQNCVPGAKGGPPPLKGAFALAALSGHRRRFVVTGHTTSDALRLMRCTELTEALRRRRSVVCFGTAALAAVCVVAGVEEICLRAAYATASTPRDAILHALLAVRPARQDVAQTCTGVIRVALAPWPGADRLEVVDAFDSVSHLARVVAASMRVAAPKAPWRLFGAASRTTGVDAWCSGLTAQYMAVAAIAKGRTRIDIQ